MDLLTEIINKQPLEKIKYKVLLSIILIFIFSLILHLFYNHESNWYHLYTENLNDMPFFESVMFTSTCWFTLGFSNITPKSNEVKSITLLIMMFAYIIILL
jgi:ABC-type phosphate/phosphonate transport system permease subunit